MAPCKCGKKCPCCCKCGDECGQGLYEYATIVMVATVIVFAVLSVFGPEIGQAFSQFVGVV